MAFTPLVPVTWNISMIPTLLTSFVCPNAVQNSAGSAINLSGWSAFQAQIIPPSANPTGAAAVFGTVTGSSTGILTLDTSATDLDTVAPGTASLAISGKAASGDSWQLLATGIISVNNYP